MACARRAAPRKASSTLAERIATATPPNPTTLAVSANESPLSDAQELIFEVSIGQLVLTLESTRFI
jgi:hypothetical protein